MYQIDRFMNELERKNPNQDEFIQASREVIESILDLVNDTPSLVRAKILERLCEPDRVFMFKVEWEDDNYDVQINKGYRIQFNNSLGPYKGGLRFHPSVSLGGLKFLGFEQIFKNSLTTLALGGGKGGSDFDPKGKSEDEIRRFCKSFMTQVYHYIGPNTDVPAGDIGVGGREIGFLYGTYKKLVMEHTGVLTGKGLNWGGSQIRPEATGFGNVYYANEMLKYHGDSIAGKTVAVSGFGNVAWGACAKANELGAKVVTISGPDGYVFDKDGISGEKLDYMLDLRSSNEDIVKPYAEKYGADYFAGKRPWEQKVDIALPCAIQNELDGNDAKMLIENGVKCVSEGANMPCNAEAIELFQKNKILFGPGKAANAGGVSISGIEMTQNSMKLSWSREEVDAKLQEIMKNIHSAGVQYGLQKDGYVNYVKGSNIAGFLKVAQAMMDMGY